jgi:SAM-dependent methyltransferase
VKDIIDDKIYYNKYKHEIEQFIADTKLFNRKYQVDPSTPIKLNKLCSIEDWGNNEMIKVISETQRLGALGGIHRKEWEWAMGIIAMRRLGMLNEKSIALGVGSGKEPVLFCLSNIIKHVYATDIYEGKSWTEAPSDFPENPKKYCASRYNEKALTVLRMDGTKLEFQPDYFDIVFSFSSIEHFGGRNHSGALSALKEIERVLKPGGIAVITTELIINGKNDSEFFNAETIYSDLIGQLAQLQLVEPLDLTITPRTLDTVLDYFPTALMWDGLNDDYKRTHPHILLRRKNLLWTSVILVFRKII